jgi:hypothetical protein
MPTATPAQRAYVSAMDYRKSSTTLGVQNLTRQRSVWDCLSVLVGRLSYGKTGRWGIEDDLKDDAQFHR